MVSAISDAVTTFRRDNSGELVQLSDITGCIRNNDMSGECARGRALDSAQADREPGRARIRRSSGPRRGRFRAVVTLRRGCAGARRVKVSASYAGDAALRRDTATLALVRGRRR